MRDKQIEEMSEVITTVISNRCWHNGCTMCEFESENHCQCDLLATALVEDYGYRKVSDVAREIGAILSGYNAGNYAEVTLLNKFYELKKKYESEGEG